MLSCDSIYTAEPESNLLHKHFYIRQKSTLPHVTVSKNHAATKLGWILALHDVTTAQHSVTKNQKQGQAANKGATEELREEEKKKITQNAHYNPKLTQRTGKNAGNASVTPRGGEKPTVWANSLNGGIGVKEVDTRKSLDIWCRRKEGPRGREGGRRGGRERIKKGKEWRKRTGGEKKDRREQGGHFTEITESEKKDLG